MLSKRVWSIIICVLLVLVISVVGAPGIIGGGTVQKNPSPSGLTPSSLPTLTDKPRFLPHVIPPYFFCKQQLQNVMNDACIRFDFKPLDEFADTPAGQIDFCGEKIPQQYLEAYLNADHPKAISILQRWMDHLRVVDEDTVRQNEMVVAAQMHAILNHGNVTAGPRKIPEHEALGCMQAMIQPGIMISDRLLYTKISFVQQMVEEHPFEMKNLMMGHIPVLHCYDERDGNLAEIGPKIDEKTCSLKDLKSPMDGILGAYANPGQIAPWSCSCLEMAFNDFTCGSCPGDGDFGNDFEIKDIGNVGDIDIIDIGAGNGELGGWGNLPGDIVSDLENPFGGCGGAGGGGEGADGGGWNQVGECSLGGFGIPSAPESIGEKIMRCNRENPESSATIGGFDDGSFNELADPYCQISQFAGPQRGCDPVMNNECEGVKSAQDSIQAASVANPGAESNWLSSFCSLGESSACEPGKMDAAVYAAEISVGDVGISDFLTGLGLTVEGFGIILSSDLFSGDQAWINYALTHEMRHVECTQCGCCTEADIAYRDIGDQCGKSDSTSKDICDHAQANYCASGGTNSNVDCEKIRKDCQEDEDSTIAGCGMVNKQCQENPTLAGCPSQEDCNTKNPPPPGCAASAPADKGDPDPHGPDNCSAEARRFMSIFKCIYGEDPTIVNPLGPDCPASGGPMGCDNMNPVEFMCLGDISGLGQGSAIDCGPDKVWCPITRTCQENCLGSEGSVSSSFGAGWHTDCEQDKVLCADGRCHENCEGFGMELWDSSCGLSDLFGGGTGPVGPEPEPGP